MSNVERSPRHPISQMNVTTWLVTVDSMLWPFLYDIIAYSEEIIYSFDSKVLQGEEKPIPSLTILINTYQIKDRIVLTLCVYPSNNLKGIVLGNVVDNHK